MDEANSHLRQQATQSRPAATIGATVEQLDVGAVITAAQAVSGEIVLDRLIETLMRSRSKTPARNGACSFSLRATGYGSRPRAEPIKKQSRSPCVARP
jgi:hypothetical protein